MRTRSLVIATALAAAAAACGGGSSNPDSRVSDANKNADVGNPDAHVKTRAGTLAVTDVKITDPAVASLAIGGGAVSFEFDDLTMNDGGTVAYDDTGGTGVGGCTVFTFDGSTHKPHPAIDEGPITISGAGLKGKPNPLMCTFAGSQYVCVADAATGVSGTYSASSAGGAAVTITGHDFTADDIGTYLTLSGFADAGMNHSYAIINVISTSAQLAVPASTVQSATNKAFTGVSYTKLQGAGPIPGGQGTVDFINLGAGTDQLTVDLAANTDYPTAITATVPPIGKPLLLDDAGTGCTDCKQPYQFPTSAASGETVTFSCDKTIGSKTGNCGEGEPPTFNNVGLVITGSTTDADLTNAAPYDMPPANGSYARFTCSFPTGMTGQVTNGALAAILATSPTRVETRVFRFGFTLPTADPDTKNTWTVVAGHGIIGHTDL